MQILSQILFLLVLIAAIIPFRKSVLRIRKNILLGKDQDLVGTPKQRLNNMMRVAMGQGKMVRRPIAGILHIIVYAGFILINIEVIEMVIDGLFGTHRALSVLGLVYDLAIGFFEILAIMVLLACIFLLTRRFISKIPRFHSPEMKGWATKDATYILLIEIVLMTALIKMNAADQVLQARGVEGYHEVGTFPVSQFLAPAFDGMFSNGTLIFFERAFWWFHMLGILAFLNYVPFSKHLHIFLAFPNTYYTNQEELGKFENMASVTNEVKMMLDPSAGDPNAPPPESFGVKDVTDLGWKNLMEAYSCTECGRCTSVCPANITGKQLSPRKVMMDTRDRLEEVGKNIESNGEFKDDGKNLHSYISKEELWACTTCNACADACPIEINPMNIIYQMRQYLVMEKAESPNELNIMNTNIENNGAPWQFPASDRAKWTEEA